MPKRLLPKITLGRTKASLPIIKQWKPQEHRDRLLRAETGIYRQNSQSSQHPKIEFLRPILLMMKGILRVVSGPPS